MLKITPSDLPPRDAYRLFISLLVPRPIAWVSTIGADGSLNLAPYSFFIGVAGTPPTVMFSVSLRKGAIKDTLVIGQVVLFHLCEGLLRPNGLVDASLLQPLARLGGDEYGHVREVFDLPRPR